MNQVLLTTLNAKYIHMNLAIRILYGQNKQHQGLQWHEFAIKEKPEEIASYCASFEVVCFSCYIWNITHTLRVIELIKQLNPAVKILLGGPEVSYDWQEQLKHPHIDYIIPGEGEIPFRDFMNAYPNVSSVKGLAHKIDGTPVLNPQLENFDLLELTDFNPYVFEDPSTISTRVAYMETSRGCPYKCEFCLASLDNKVRYLATQTIKDNLLFLMQHGKVIKFLDRTFNVKKDFTLDIFQFILDNHQPGNVFQFEITADIVHPDIVAFIQEKVPKGLFRFEIGIQTVNKQANLEVSRKQNFDKTAGVIKQLQDHIDMHLDLIVGLPLDYYSDIQYSFEQVFALHPAELQLGFLKFLKGTPVREKYEKYGYVFDPNPPYQIIESNYLSAAELKQITALEEALELYWNKKRAVNTLMYAEQVAGIFNFLQGLGTYFEQHAHFHKHSLDDSFHLLAAFIEKVYPQHPVLLQLAAIDYYLHFKIKPKTFLLEEVSREEKKAAIFACNGNTNKFRYIVLPIDFNFEHFNKTNQVQMGSHHLVICYNGQTKAHVAGQLAFGLNQVVVEI